MKSVKLIKTILIAMIIITITSSPWHSLCHSIDGASNRLNKKYHNFQELKQQENVDGPDFQAN